MLILVFISDKRQYTSLTRVNTLQYETHINHSTYNNQALPISHDENKINIHPHFNLVTLNAILQNVRMSGLLKLGKPTGI